MQINPPKGYYFSLSRLEKWHLTTHSGKDTETQNSHTMQVGRQNGEQSGKNYRNYKHI